MSELISLKEAEEKGIERLKLPIWAIKEDHVKIDLINGQLGPLTHLYSPFNQACNGEDPFTLLITEWGDLDKKQFEVYKGPLPDSDEYKKKSNDFVENMKN